MTPRQRWLAILNRRPVDRVPTDYQATPEVTERLQRELRCADREALYRRLHIDGRRWLGPAWKRRGHPDDPQADAWGVRYSRVDYGTGAYEEATHHPLADCRSPDDVHRHAWPSPDDYDYSPIVEALARDDGYRAIAGGSFEPFLLYGALRGLEQSYEDLLTEPEIADAILGHIFEFHHEFNRRIFEAGNGRIDVTTVAEDLGSQTGPLMSLEVYRRYLLPDQKKMADLARSYGIHVLYHTDGSARMFLSDLVDVVGIEVLNPIQWRCPGMEREQLVAAYGQRIVFHGSIDNQKTLAFGSVDDVIREVEESREIYREVRWICAPCHNIQPVTPTANIVAMYETIRRAGRN